VSGSRCDWPPWSSALPEGECSARAPSSPSRTGPTHRIRALPSGHPCGTPESGNPRHASRAVSPHPEVLGVNRARPGAWRALPQRSRSVVRTRQDGRPNGRPAPRGSRPQGFFLAATPRPGRRPHPELVRVGRPVPGTSPASSLVDLTDQLDRLDAVGGTSSAAPGGHPWPRSKASLWARLTAQTHASTRPTVPRASRHGQYNRPGRALRGDTSRPTSTAWPNCQITAHPSGWTAPAANGSAVADSPRFWRPPRRRRHHPPHDLPPGTDKPRA
jgi:hypothetical protein